MDGFQIVPTGNQGANFAEVQRIMSSIAPPKAGNPRILAIDQQPLMKAKNGGYPKHMYHASLDPQLVLREDQEQELSKIGYVETYIPREYPRTLYRRNMDARYEEQIDPGTKQPTNHEYVETRVARDKEHEERILKERKPKTVIGDWVLRLEDIAPLPEAPDEDPAVTIANLKGQLVGRDAAATEPRRK